MKIRLPKRRIWRVAIYIVSTLLVLLAIDLIMVRVGRQITPGYDTTRITSPTKADGSIDYLTAIETRYSAGVTNDNNAAPLLLEAIGRGGLPANQPRDGITARLGMAPMPDRGDYFQTWESFTSSADPSTQPASQPATQSATGPIPTLDQLIDSMKASDAERAKAWLGVDDPQITKWVALNEKPLARLTKASKRERWFMPFNGGTPPVDILQIQLPYLMHSRNICRAMVARAMVKAGKGDIAGAREDLMTVHRIAGLLGSGATIIDRLVSYAIDGVASSAEMSLATSGKVDAAQAKAWMAALQHLPPINGFADCIDTGERYMFCDIMQVSARVGLGHFTQALDSGQPGKFPIGPNNSLWSFVPMNYDATMRAANPWYDRMTEAAGKQDPRDRRAALAVIQKDLEAFIAQTRPWHVLTRSDWPIAAFVPALMRLNERIDTTVAKRNLATVSLALAAYRAEDGSYPESLDALQPIVGKLPADPFGGSFIYHASKTGFVLYSVGANEKDDGGKADDLLVQTGS